MNLPAVNDRTRLGLVLVLVGFTLSWFGPGPAVMVVGIALLWDSPETVA